MFHNHPHFVQPDYNQNNFSLLPALVKRLLTGQGAVPFSPTELLHEQYETVVLFFIDAFGWEFFQRHKDNYPFLQAVLADGEALKMSSQFPSTTTAHVTTIHTGRPVGDHGLFEWRIYEPALKQTFCPLLFSYGWEYYRETLLKEGIKPETIFEPGSYYDNLTAAGIDSYIFQKAEYARSSYSDIVFAGANMMPYKTLPEAFVNMRRLLTSKADKPRYCFFYYADIDSICHSYGPNTPQHDAEIDAFLTLLEQQFRDKLAGKLPNTLFLMTADHGQTHLNPETAVYINQHLPHFADYLLPDGNGKPLGPAGSCRDMFLYVKDEHLDTAEAEIKPLIAGKAEIYRTTQLLEAGLFGNQISEKLLSRLGNLVILPYAGESVWWYEENRYKVFHKGHHGGLTPAEVEIPLLVYPF